MTFVAGPVTDESRRRFLLRQKRNPVAPELTQTAPYSQHFSIRLDGPCKEFSDRPVLLTVGGKGNCFPRVYRSNRDATPDVRSTPVGWFRKRTSFSFD